MQKLVFIFSFTCASLIVGAQTTFPSNGAPNETHTLYSFTNCTLHVDADVTVLNASLLVKDGKVIRFGEKLEIPKEAISVDLKGKHIYPAFIDLYSDYGMPESKRSDHTDAPKKGAYGWNQAIKSEIEAQKLFLHNQTKADELRKQGFATVLTSSKDGIVRGSGALVFLANAKENESILKDKAAGFYSFNKGTSPQDYPESLMGAVALLRQTYYDAAWYKSNETKTEYNITLDAFNKLQELPSIFEGGDKYNDIRGKNVGDEFKVKYIIKGGGNEYQRLHDIKNSLSKFIIPINYPEALDVEDPYDAEQASLSDLKHWEMAPANLAMLEKNGIPFCITSYDLKNKSDFLKNLRKAIKYGLSEKTALKALTYNPASFIGMQDKIGALKQGMYANFFISSTSIFDEDAIIFETWSNGIKHVYRDLAMPEIKGTYTLVLDKSRYKMDVTKDQDNYGGYVYLKDSAKAKINLQFKNNLMTLSFPYDTTLVVRLSGNYNEPLKEFKGTGQYADGTWLNFTMTQLQVADTTKPKKVIEKAKLDIGQVYYPFTAYGEPLTDNTGFFTDTWSKFN